MKHPENKDLFVPQGVRVAASWSWRLLLIGIAAAAALWLIVQVRLLVIPLLIAILLSALLLPIVRLVERVGAPRWLGIITALFAFTIAVCGLITLIVTQLRGGLGDLGKKSLEVWRQTLDWIEHNPIGISADQLQDLFNGITKTLQTHQSEIVNGALGLASSAGQIVTGTLLTLFSLIFLLIDGERIWFWLLGFFPRNSHAAADAAGRAAWVSVGQYVRVQILVAFTDAVGIGIGAALLGVPLPIPIAILVFLGSFIPFLGAITTGALAVFIALVYNGPVNALIMLAVVLLVNQVEGHILQPLVMGSAVQVHPLGVVLVVSMGAMLGGIAGALFAVPIAAAANVIVRTISSKQWQEKTDPVHDYWRQQKKANEAKTRARLVSKLRKRGTSR